jgi:hypothetical protein
MDADVFQVFDSQSAISEKTQFLRRRDIYLRSHLPVT